MEKKTTIITGVIFLGTLGLYLLSSRSSPMNTSTNSIHSELPTTSPHTDNSDQTSITVGHYYDYSQEVLERTKDKKRVLFFSSTTCDSCSKAEQDFLHNADGLPEDIRLIKVDFEDATLRNTYNVTNPHTFIQLDATENEITRWQSGGIEELINNLH